MLRQRLRMRMLWHAKCMRIVKEQALAQLQGVHGTVGTAPLVPDGYAAPEQRRRRAAAHGIPPRRAACRPLCVA
jgi:hypothetical protein